MEEESKWHQEASRGINKVILIGHLGQDPEVRYTPGGNVVTNLTLATSEAWRDKITGEHKEVTEWHRVVLFGKVGEIAGQYLRKGSLVYIEGQLRTRKWQDQSGQDKYTTEIIVNSTGTLHMLNKREISEHTDQPSHTLQSEEKGEAPFAENAQYPEKQVSSDDDIPF